MRSRLRFALNLFGPLVGLLFLGDITMDRKFSRMLAWSLHGVWIYYLLNWANMTFSEIGEWLVLILMSLPIFLILWGVPLVRDARRARSPATIAFSAAVPLAFGASVLFLVPGEGLGEGHPALVLAAFVAPSLLLAVCFWTYWRSTAMSASAAAGQGL